MKWVISVLVWMIMIMSVGIGVFAADEEIADFSKANKVGIINDTNTLNKIKNGNVAGMQELLSLAKSSNNTIFNQTVNSTKSGESYANGYDDNIDITYDKLKDGAYYYLYVKLDDENGKNDILYCLYTIYNSCTIL